ncbi:MAG: MetQ/NlpA family ABC transporter substrate-binding protein [Bacillota bacterium]|nr:MetQ/NlpA family ABC transporter substrate-binding protein [Bacillota bacterium]
MNIRRMAGAACLLVLLAAVPALAADQTIRVGFMPAEDELPLWVAEKEGLFAREGVKVELVNFASAIERDTALQAGQVDGVNGDLVAIILNARAGVKAAVTSISLGVTPREGRFAIFSAPKSPIRTVADLKGVEIGVSFNTIQDYVTDQLLLDGGLKPREIRKVGVPKVPIRFQMLMNGQIQAAALPDPMGALAEAQGAHLVASDTEARRNLSPIVYFFTRKALKEKSEAFDKFYRAYREAVKRINADPEKYRPLLVEKARIPEQIKDTYPMLRYPMPALPTKAEWQDVVEWMMAKKLIEGPYRYEDFMEDRFTR